MTTTYAPGTCVAIHLSDAPTFVVRILDSKNTRWGNVYTVETLTGRWAGRVETFGQRDIVGIAADPALVALASDPAVFGSDEYHAQIDEFVTSDLDAATIARLVFELRTTSVAIVSLKAESAPLWTVIDSDEDDAREYVAREVAEVDEDPEYIRWCLAQPLVHGGWTLAKVRRHLG